MTRTIVDLIGPHGLLAVFSLMAVDALLRMQRAQVWFDRHGRAAVLLGRLTPLVRSFISVPAGVFGSPLGSYVALTALGSAIWCFAFAGAGWALGSNWESLHGAFRYVDLIAIAALLGIAAWLLLRGRSSAT
jgi:membrane protein DedA with SNARE-associated domain